VVGGRYGAVNIEDAIRTVRAGTSRQVMVKCPAHDDGTASLAVKAGTTEQPVIFHCHAECEPQDIVKAANLEWGDVCAPLDQRQRQDYQPPSSITPVVYSYEDADGSELFQALRFAKPGGGKDFRQRHRDEHDQWVWNLNGVQRVLYRLPQVVEAVREGVTVWLVEGEKDVHTAESVGLVATTNPMGAGKWLPEYTETLRGATVKVVADADKVGRRHARAVADMLRQADCRVTVHEARQGCKDLTDHIAAGGTEADLIDITHSEEEATSSAPSYGMDVLDYIALTFSAEQFVIPFTLAHEERLLLTGLEGHGKSTIIRQWAVMVAAGIHPVLGTAIPPRRVLVIDAENGRRQMQRSWQELVGLATRHGHPIDPGMITLQMEYLSQPDLTSLEGRDWFYERVSAYRPDMICVGPIQNLTGRDVKDDDVVRKFKRSIDEAREISGAAVVMEHHAPHKAAGDRERSLRPYGSSLFLKWPDFAYGMKPVTDEKGVYDWEPLRFPRDRNRVWPERIRWGTPNTLEWPWELAEPTDGGAVSHA
jgi:AAA domain